ncbi:hypothetical protein BH18ACT14_BH18ACT14_16260 [soil metagenome]
MPLIAFILLALVCFALFGFACACLSDHPMQALERALSTIPALPALVEVWALTVLALLAAGILVAGGETLSRSLSPAVLQRFRF